MGLEIQGCCGALTHVYRDAGNRRHNASCRFANDTNTLPESRDYRVPVFNDQLKEVV